MNARHSLKFQLHPQAADSIVSNNLLHKLLHLFSGILKTVNLKFNQFKMTEVIIDKKKFIILPEKDYKALQKQAALKTKSEKLLSLEDARAYSKKLIRKWAAEK